jgi:hypothetical protein
MKITLFWEMKPFGLIYTYQCVGGMLIAFFQAAWIHIPGKSSIYSTFSLLTLLGIGKGPG